MLRFFYRNLFRTRDFDAFRTFNYLKEDEEMKLKKILFVGALAVVAAAAYARPTHGSTTTYYSDATYAIEVGGTELTCNGARYSWGETSSYSRITEVYPCS